MTAVIYLVIIAVWAAVLVPMWLRRHDHRRSERPARGWTERAFLRLSERTSLLGIPLPARAAEVAGEPSHGGSSDLAEGDGGAPGGEDQPVQVHGQPARRRRHERRRVSGAAKRRVMLLLLLLSTAGVIATVVLGLLPWPVLAAPTLVIVAFFLVAHRQVVVARRNRQRQERRRQGRESAVAQPQADAPQVDALSPGTWLPRATPLPAYLRTAQDDTQVSSAAPAWTAAAMLERAQRERQRAERQADRDAAERERVRAEQRAAALDDRDDTYLRGQAVRWRRGPIEEPFRRAANE